MPKWTQQQQQAIDDRGRSLIVCAAAGSGKTAVLVERITQLVCEGCPIEQMLIVTFTNAAAGEMRLRIGEALSERAAQRPELAQEVSALPRASISTLHRFCGNLLREHFEALGIDPSFRIADESEANVLRHQAMEDALYACYEVGSEVFLAADACYEQEELTRIAETIYKYMMSRPDPWTWLERSIRRLDREAADNAGMRAAETMLAEAETALTRMEERARQALALCDAPGGPLHFRAAAEDDLILLGDMRDAARRGHDALVHALGQASYARLGRRKKSDPPVEEEAAEQFKRMRDEMKAGIKKLGETFSAPLFVLLEDLEMTKKPLEGIAELLRTYDALYRAQKQRRGVMDFNDLEHGALAALEQEQVREAMAGRYRYVFVDEYQDSSAIQEKILECFAPERGIFCVGDVKQSIYRFRQAEPEIFLERARRYDEPGRETGMRIDLQSNFRSRCNVLEGVNAVFERIMHREETEIEYDERERLIPGLPVREDDPPIELHLLYKEADAPEEGDAQDEDAQEEETDFDPKAIEREALAAAARIKALKGTMFYDAKRAAERALCYRDMAVLMRVSAGAAPLAAEILQAEGIPVFCDAGTGYFDIPEIRAVMALLAAVENGTRDEALLAALRGPALGLSEAQLAQIRIHTPDTRVPYHMAVRAYREQMEDELALKLRAFEEKRLRWQLYARHRGVDRLIESIYAETGFAAHAGVLPGGQARQANLQLLVSRARMFMQTQGGSLGAFLRYAGRLKAGGDTMNASAIGENEDVVRIMTVHKSKGLEFPVVFVLGLGRKIAAKRERIVMDDALGIGLPCVDTDLSSERDTILRQMIRRKLQREQLSEEIRILYVAMTRARERLILIGDTKKDAPTEGWLMGTARERLMKMSTQLDMLCPVLCDAGAVLDLPQEQVTAGKSQWHIYAHRSAKTFVHAPRTDERAMRLIAGLEAEGVTDERMEKLMAFEAGDSREAVRKMSVSDLLRDEKRAGEDEIHVGSAQPERLPRFMQQKHLTGAQIGTAFHRVMCVLDLDAMRRCTSIEAEAERQLAVLREEGVTSQAEHAAIRPAMLTGLFASPVGVRLLRSARVEREWAFTWRMKDAEGKTRLLQGMIDCCFTENGKWVLVDYKTDADADGARERHKEQVMLYARALEEITGMPVGDCIVYLVRRGIEIHLNDEEPGKADFTDS